MGSRDQNRVVRRAKHTGKSWCQVKPAAPGGRTAHGQQLRSLHWAGGATLLCADALCEIHCRDLKVSQRLTKWELEWQNDPVTLLRLGRRRSVGVLLLRRFGAVGVCDRVKQVWTLQIMTKWRLGWWKSAVLFLSFQCFLPNIICLHYVFSLLFAVTDGLQFSQPIPAAGVERREMVFALLVIRDLVSTEELHKGRKLLVWGVCPLNGRTLAGTVSSIPGAGNGIQVSWLLNPASQLLVST